MSAGHQRMSALGAATFVTAGVASSQLVGGALQRNGRDTLFVSNDHATAIIYLALGTTAAVVGSGIRVGTGQVLALEGYSGPVQVISTVAAANVCVHEL